MKKVTILLLSLTSLVIVETTLENPIINRNNLFAVDICQDFNNRNQNFLVSPFAAYTGLSLIRSGAKEESADQLRKALYGSNDLQEDELAFKELLQDLGNTKITNIASTIFVDEIYKIRDEYQQRALDVYNATTSNIKLAEKGEAAAVINEWVKKATKTKIEKIIKPEDIETDGRIISLNALHIEANWAYGFESSNTVDEIFFVPGGQNVKVKTMKTCFRSSYAETEKAKILELPLTNCETGENLPGCSGASLVIVLPNEIDGVDKLKMNEVLKRYPVPLILIPINVSLPRFEFKTPFVLESSLKTLGVDYIFNSTTANLGGIASAPGDIRLAKFIQTVSLKVDEQGVAAAGTAEQTFETKPTRLRRAASSEKCVPEESVDFRVNHPFFYYVRNNNGLITFVGKVYDPTVRPILPFPPVEL